MSEERFDKSSEEYYEKTAVALPIKKRRVCASDERRFNPHQNLSCSYISFGENN
jgi:hypothetical protein